MRSLCTATRSKSGSVNKHKVRARVTAGITEALVYQSRPNTYVRITARIDDTPYTAVGFAKVRWGDTWDTEYGCALAAKKAVAKITKAILAGGVSQALHDEYDGDTVRDWLGE